MPQLAERDVFGFFPAPYPDETVPSLVARLRSNLGATQLGVTQAIYGAKQKTISPLLPSSMDRLLAVFPAELGYNAKRLIDNHTAINYFTAFMDENERQRVISTFLLKPKRGLTKGMAAAPINNIDFLRFCRSCQREQKEKYGECFWRLSHQLPISLFCTVHDEILCLSRTSSNDINTVFSTPDAEVCPVDAEDVLHGCGEVNLDDLKTLAVWATDLLRGRFPPGFNKDWPRTNLLEELSFRDFRFPRGGIRHGRLAPEFKRALSGIIPAFPDILDGDDIGRWFSQLCADPLRPPPDRVLVTKLALDRLEDVKGGRSHC